MGINATICAMSLGARIIEKHITLDQEADGPDHIFSLTPNMLYDLCNARDELERILYK
jgi:sialic acid synthase SpsE